MTEPSSLRFAAPGRIAALPVRLLSLLMLFVLAACATTETLEVAPKPVSDRYSALVIDARTGTTLYSVNAGATRYPASLTKMMTLYLLFEAMEQGRVTASTEIPVSALAARQPPTKIGFRGGGTIDVDSAIRALTVKSANDVAYAVGEYLGGSEDNFAQMMTAKARAIGMSGTTFRNASGLPDAEQRTTARDMAVLGLALRARFPQYYPYFSATDFSYRGRLVRGHNDVLKREGVDGIKTGYIRASGYNIVTSYRGGGKSLVIVVMGADSARERNAQVMQLIDTYTTKASGGSAMTALFGSRDR